MSRTFLSLFSGGELVGVGAKAAGYKHIGGVEIDPKIAAVAQRNGFDVTVADILDVSPDIFDRPDLLHASPVCTNASIANPKATESENDIATAEKVVEFIHYFKPRFVTIENVMGYRKFVGFKKIITALADCGYMYDVQTLNAADFGVPQTRRRLFVRAVRDGFVPFLPPSVKWVGWYEAIEDLLDDLPDSQFANWQLARLPLEVQTSMIGQQMYGETVQNAPRNKPAFTITANSNQVANRAFLFAGAGNTNMKEAMSGKGVRWDDEPAHTIAAAGGGGRTVRAFLMPGENGSSARLRGVDEVMPTISSSQKAAHRVWLEQGRVVKISVRALARLMSVPDDYWLPPVATLAGKVLGNGVPPLMYRRIVEAFGGCDG